MPPDRKSARFEPTVPLPPQTILSLETELSYFRRRHPLLLNTDLRSLARIGYLPQNHLPYRYPVSRRGGTPEKDCLDWAQYPLAPAVAAAIRTIVDTAEVPLPDDLVATGRQPSPVATRTRQRTPVPTCASSHQPTPSCYPPAPRQPTPGPSMSAQDPPQTLGRIRIRPVKTVRFPSEAPEAIDNEGGEKVAVSVALPDADGLISKPDGEVGRRHRGYPLQDVLGWPEGKFKTFRELVISYVANYLDHSLSASNQPKNAVADLTKLASCSHLILLLY